MDTTFSSNYIDVRVKSSYGDITKLIESSLSLSSIGEAGGNKKTIDKTDFFRNNHKRKNFVLYLAKVASTNLIVMS